ncbi:LacI family DNA-binding transcriptional regulator [Ectobacillus ponti]|uniref:LacI family transcriptional regulator n=1 Tax=Ectobacillus ponti TaxID=2961894 RepID=A0AA42BSM0_9BACI|nr:LacI family DNA-binding transcriptional regulator [Ectobacillus ponti]MCP8970674.1 LacI family transcriptional regulator [Ectobacillus ponti]
MTKLTMKDIARLANVSQPTVSRVINGNKAVNEDIAKKVMKVIEEVGYIPNKAAQTLKKSSSHIIGVCVTEVYNPYFVELIETLEAECRKIGYNILLHNSKHNPITEWESIQNFLARQVDGLILVPASDYNMQRISELSTPSVIITQNKPQLDSIGLNHLQAGKIVVESFIRAGHKKFGFIGTEIDEKFLGFDGSLRENGFTFDKRNYVRLEVTSIDNFLMRRDIEKYFTEVGRPDFTCAFAANDIMALEFMKAAQERNIRIPEDISLVGFDDTYLAKIMGISSIHQPIEEMVKMTIEILQNRIEHEVSSTPVTIQLEPMLIERNSSRWKRID